MLAVPAVVLADGRVALVVGNSTYAHIGRLPNPDNDARDMSAALRWLGFEVTTELDADRVELTAALRAFTRRSLRNRCAHHEPVFARPLREDHDRNAQRALRAPELAA